MGPKEQAEFLFSLIGWGKENSVTRPKDPNVDRELRDFVKKHNSDEEKLGVIINVGNGYYKPRSWVLEEKLEFREYRAKDNSRERELHSKGKIMDYKFYRMETDEEYEQLSLPV